MNFDGYQKLDIELDDKNIDEVLFSDENIICFKSFNTKDDFIEEWHEVQTSVAGNIQANLDKLKLNDSLAWNMYIIFLINFKMDKQEKNKIDSNKFCCKKYIVQVNDLSNDEEKIRNIENSIALFSKFDFSEGSSSSSNKNKIKEKIFENSKQSILMNKFKNTSKIYEMIEEENISSFINELKREYQDEN